MELLKKVRHRLTKKKSMRISEHQPYVLSLASMDVDYIKTDVMNMYKPIWDASRDRQRDYFEFHIISDSENSENDDDEVIKGDDTSHQCELTSYLCNICDVQVPIIYHDNHQRSTKHKTYTDLTNKVMQRIAKHITLTAGSSKNVQTNTYYCGPCSKVISMNNKSDHELSKQHLNSLEHDKHMQDLVQMYTTNELVKEGNSKGGSNSRKTYGDVVKSGTIHHKLDVVNDLKNANLEFVDSNDHIIAVNNDVNLGSVGRIGAKINTDPLVIEETDSENETDLVINSQCVEEATSVLKFLKDNGITPSNDTVAKNLNSSTNNDRNVDVINDLEKQTYLSHLDISKGKAREFQSYINKMICVYNIERVPIVTDDKIIYNNSQNHRILVSLYNYHGLKMDGDDIRCSLCRRIISEDVEIHMRSGSHMIVDALSPINDQYMRKITDTSSYCMVCNVMVYGDANTHANQDRKHQAFLALCRTKEPMSGHSAVIHCVECNRDIHIHNYFAHINGNGHKSSVRASYISKNKKNDNYVSNILDNDSKTASMINNPGSPTCGVTKNDKSLIATNDKSLGVAVGVSNDESSPGVSNVGANCKPIPVTDVGDNKAADFKIPLYMKAGKTDKDKKCALCNVYVPYTRKNITEHINAINHKNTLNKYVNDNNIKITDDSYKCKECKIFIEDIISHVKIYHTNDDYCYVCDVKLPPNGREIHEKGARHKESLKANPKVIYQCESVDYDVLLRGGVIELVGNQLMCKICNAGIPNFDDCVKEHVLGRRHITNRNILRHNDAVAGGEAKAPQ